MALRAMTFDIDIDGTLVDTNPSHVEAGRCAVWRDTGHLCADLDRALEIASLATAASE